MTEFIQSKRLELRPMTPGFLKASLKGDRFAAAQWLGASVPRDWPDIPEILSMRLQQLRKEPMLQPWLLRAMCHREERAMVGHIGFHNLPGADYLKTGCRGRLSLVSPYSLRTVGKATPKKQPERSWGGLTKLMASENSC
jgi:hypothetical protein